MSYDELRESLEDLFSDLSLSESEEDIEALLQPQVAAGEATSEPESSGAAPGRAQVSPPVASALPRSTLPDDAGASTPGRQEGGQEGASTVEDLQTWRQELARRVLRALVVIGLVALAAGIYDAYTHQDEWLIPFYLGAYAILILITFWRRVRYVPQALALMGLLYGLGVLDLLEDGIGGSGRVFLMALPFVAVLFFGIRAGVLALVLVFLTMAGCGLAFSTGLVVVPVEKQVVSDDPIVWLSGTFVLILAAALPVASLSYLLPRFAVSLAQSRSLSRALASERDTLEKQVRERTRALQEANYALQRRAIQLETSAEIGRAITSIFDVDELLRRAVDLIRDRFGFYHAGIFLIDETGEWAVLREATGEAGAQMKAQGHRLAVSDTSMVGWTALHRRPRIALYAQEDGVRFANPLLPHTRSEMTLPLIVGAQLLGVLNVQSTEEAAFEEDDVRVLQSMADQIAIALENARRVSDEAALLEATSPIYRTSRRLTTATATDEVADAIIASVAETEADGCIVVEFELSPAGTPEALLYRGVWRRDREPQFRAGERLPITRSPFPLEMVSTLWVVSDVEEDDHLPQSARQVFVETGAKALVNIPLHARDKVIGQVVVLRATPGPFSEGALRLYGTLSDLAAVALERAQLLEEAQRRAEREQRVRQMLDRIRRAGDIEQALRTTAEEFSRAIDVPHVSIELTV